MKSNVHETWVSTDDKKIQNIARQFGSNVIIRPSSLSTDISPSEQSLIHFADKVAFDILVFIQTTSPLLNHIDIDIALKMMDDYDSVFSVYKEHWLPRWSTNIMPINWDPSKRPMRQDIKSNYVENGALYITKRENLLKFGIRYSGKIGVYEMPFSRSFQIDNWDDLKIVERMMKSE